MNGIQHNSVAKKAGGPDIVIPASSSICTSINGAVRINKSDDFAKPYISVATSLKQSADKYQDHPALSYKIEDKWTNISYQQFYKSVQTVAKAFLKLGLEKYHSVCILGINSPEWLLSSFGAMMAGGIQAGIYTTNSAEACLHCLKKSYANIVVVQNTQQLEKILQVRDQAPLLKAIIQIEGTPSYPDVLSWKQLVEIGEKESNEQLEKALQNTAVNECCAILFTSGTTGLAKGVMLSHDNIVFTAKAIHGLVNFKEKCERVLTYLPLSHIAEQIILCLTLQIGGTIYFADANVLKGTLIDNLKAVKPTIFFGVPRIWEKIKEGIEAKVKSAPVIKKWLLYGTSSVMIHKYKHLSNGYSMPLMNKIPAVFQYLVCNKIKDGLGLSECRYFFSGAAPIMLDTKEFFAGIDIPICEAYGMTESCGPITIASPICCMMKCAGKQLPHIELNIKKTTYDEEGEICSYGRHVFMGYVDDLDKTKESIDDDGRLHTGDLGKIDPHFGLLITGRLKDIIITAGGENIPTGLIEETIKSELPIISNVVLIGDARKYLTVLITLKSLIDKNNGAPLDELDNVTKQWCKQVGATNIETVSDVIQKKPKEVYHAIEAGITIANKKATSNAQKVQKFRILPKDFSIPSGEMGPTMKVKRQVVLDRYKDVIEEMYQE
ncbi:long-chain-fatty-acid--CoA ligase ACSBG2-like isoform X2 [Planococcus citri]|uniref:long-chain-fatty-acid--CoA ligase ACSBG2-like isoform X2 n=1 Tax=Planococcus citri TaxID=170843 RepID=UPI0031F7A744